MNIKLPALSLLLALSAPVFAAGTATIKVEEPWARESPPTVTNGGAYMTLVNTGKEADRLVGASGDVSATIELHTHRMEDGMMKMRPIKAIDVNPGEPATLKPGGLHIMLIGLKKPLVAGENFPLRLRFEKAGEIPVDVKVRKMGSEEGATHSPHQDHKAR